MQSHICGNVVLYLVSLHASLASATAFAGSISFSLSTNTRALCTLSSRGSRRAICFYDNGVKSELHSATLVGAQ